MAGFNDDPKKVEDRITSYTFANALVGDVAVALPVVMRAMGLTFKEVSTWTTGGFGMREIPFTHNTVVVGGKKVDIPYGSYEVEGLGMLKPSKTDDDDDPVPEMRLSVTFFDKKGNDGHATWDKLITSMEAYLADRSRSLFFGAAIRVTDPNDLLIPKYIDVTTPVNVYMNDDVAEQVEEHIFFHINEYDKLKAAGVRTQRGVLLHGRYGTGKSLIAYKAAQAAIAQKRTFILCNMFMLNESIKIARYMQPAVLFIEDMDQLTGSGLSDIRNLMSGVESKAGHDVLAILTTNFLDKVVAIDRSFMRPERIDAVIEITPPDAKTVERIILENGTGFIDPSGDWAEASQLVAKSGTVTPAVLFELLNRTKTRAIRLGKTLSVEEVASLYEGLKFQIGLTEPKPPQAHTFESQTTKAMVNIVRRGIGAPISSLE